MYRLLTKLRGLCMDRCIITHRGTHKLRGGMHGGESVYGVLSLSISTRTYTDVKQRQNGALVDPATGATGFMDRRSRANALADELERNRTLMEALNLQVACPAPNIMKISRTHNTCNCVTRQGTWCRVR